MRIIRWGMMGCGEVCEVKSGPAFRKAEHSALVAVMRRDRAKAEDFARRHGVPRWYSDAAALVADPEVEAVYVATPPHIQQPLIQSVVMELNGAGRCPSTGETAARTSRVMDAILADFRAGVDRAR